MADAPKRVKAPEPSTLDGHQSIARAIREGARDVAQAITEAFGPRVEIRHDSEIRAAEALKETLDGLRDPDELVPMVIKATREEMDDPRRLEAAIRQQHPTYYETEGQRMKRLLAEVRARVLLLCGYREEDQPTAGDVAQNELAVERADTVMAFFDLAQGHPLPRKLLPRGDRTGDWLPPGTEVTVLGIHTAVVVPEEDRVLVQMAGVSKPVSFPRSAIAKEGEEWTPPNLTGK